MHSNENLLSCVATLDRGCHLGFVKSIGFEQMLNVFYSVGYILVMKRDAQGEIHGGGELAAIGRFHDAAFDRHATDKSRVLSDETNPNTVAGRLDFDRNLLE